MIKIELNVEDMCHECPCFEEDVKTNKLYVVDKIASTEVTVSCKNRNLCGQLKSFFKDKLSPEELNLCEPDEDPKAIKECANCKYRLMSDNGKKCSTCLRRNNWEFMEDEEDD